MSVASTRILVVGDLLPGAGEILRRLEQSEDSARGMRRRLREAREILETFDFHIVLATELLRDGRGYDLAELVSGASAHAGRRRSAHGKLPVAAGDLSRRAGSGQTRPQRGDAVRIELDYHARDANRRAASAMALRAPSGRRSIIPPGPGSAALRPGPVRRKFRDRDKEHVEA